MVPRDVPDTNRADEPDSQQDLRQNDSEMFESDDATAPASPKAPDAEEERARIQSELEQTRERVLRLQAELENVHKRNAREMGRREQYASLPVIRDLLPVLDNIERAIAAANQAGEGTSLLDGVKLVHQQLMAVLERYHCTAIDALHTPFDPHLHEAISQQPTDEFSPGTVVAVAQAGYRMHDRVVRPSQVLVSTALDHPGRTPPDAPDRDGQEGPDER